MEFASNTLADDNVADDGEELVKILDRIEQDDPQLHEVIWLRFAYGFTVQQVAQAMGVSLRTAAERCRTPRPASAWNCRKANRRIDAPFTDLAVTAPGEDQQLAVPAINEAISVQIRRAVGVRTPTEMSRPMSPSTRSSPFRSPKIDDSEPRATSCTSSRLSIRSRSHRTSTGSRCCPAEWSAAESGCSRTARILDRLLLGNRLGEPIVITHSSPTNSRLPARVITGTSNSCTPVPSSTSLRLMPFTRPVTR